jgi:hypothetical protein
MYLLAGYSEQLLYSIPGGLMLLHLESENKVIGENNIYFFKLAEH